MQRPPSLVISQDDYQKISSLVTASNAPTAEQLEAEISRARVVPTGELPEDTVAMNTLVTFLDLDTNQEHSVTLVYPRDASVDDERVSVLAPVGAALIGLRVGQIIEWPVDGGKSRRIQVTAVQDLED